MPVKWAATSRMVGYAAAQRNRPATEGRFAQRMERVTGGVHVHQRQRAEQPLQQAQEREAGLARGRRHHGVLQRLQDATEHGVPRDEAQDAEGLIPRMET